MKYILLILFTHLIIIQSYSQNNINEQTSTYYLIRHAEKDRSDSNNKDPHLTKKGLIRAQNWANTLTHIQFDAVYSTNYYRTKETAKPLADTQQLEIITYDPGKIELNNFLNNTLEKTVFVVGHSNTIPNLVNLLIGNEKYSLIEDTNNSNLYIVIIHNETITDQILVID